MRRTAALLLLLAPPISAATVHGSVFDSAGQPVPHAMLRVWNACKADGEPVTRWSGASSSYQIPVDGECLVVEATAGGAKARRTFRPGGKRLEADINLPPPARLTRAEADRIIDLLRRGDPAAVSELATYTGLGPEGTAARLGDVGAVREVVFVEPYVYELKRDREPPLRVTITRDSLTRLLF